MTEYPRDIQTTSYEDYLDQNGQLVDSFKGVSMRPLLRQGRDLFVIDKKPKRRFKKGEVVAFRRGSDYVLHRIVNVSDDHYTTLGDNSIYYDYDVHDDEIIGFMTSFIRDGKKHSIDEPAYRIYSYVISRTHRLRIFCKKCLRRIKKACQK